MKHLILLVLIAGCATPRQVPPGAGLDPAVVENLDNAALSYSWAGPLRWNAIGLGVGTVAAFYSGEHELAGGLLVAAGVNLALALALDGQAQDNYQAAMRALEPPPASSP